MKSIFKENFFGLGVILVSILFVGIFIQSCDSNETVEVIDEKIESLAQSNDLQIYSIAFETYKKKTINAIKSLDIEEREKFFNNLNNDDYMMSFLEKYDLIEDNIELHKAISLLNQNRDWISLDNAEKISVFNLCLNSDIAIFPRVRSGLEEGSSECEDIFQYRMTKLNVLTSLEMLGCAALLEFPPVATLCFAAVIARHYSSVDDLVFDRNQCENNN